MVNALLNKKVEAKLLLDTGASTVLLTKRLAEKLGIKTNGENKNKGKVRLADGREVDGMYMRLDSVNVQGVEAKDVGTVVLLEHTKTNSHDGLLGMSFLSKFNFQIDTVNKKIILEKLR